MENRSLISRLIGGPENVRAAECTRRFNAKIGQSLFHSLFQRDDIVGKSLYETAEVSAESSPDKLCAIFRDFSAFFSPCFPNQKHNISPIRHFVYILHVVAV